MRRSIQRTRRRENVRVPRVGSSSVPSRDGRSKSLARSNVVGRPSTPVDEGIALNREEEKSRGQLSNSSFWLTWTYDELEDDLRVKSLSVVEIGKVGRLEGAGRTKREGKSEKRTSRREKERDDSHLSSFSSVQSSGKLTINDIIKEVSHGYKSEKERRGWTNTPALVQVPKVAVEVEMIGSATAAATGLEEQKQISTKRLPSR